METLVIQCWSAGNLKPRVLIRFSAPIMLTQQVIEFLSPLRYCANSVRRSCLLPLGGIYWDDEIPSLEALVKLPEQARNSVYRLFSIRFRIWDGQELSESDQGYWDEARLQVPHYALFQRLKLSVEDRHAQDTVGREAVECFEALMGGAKEIRITEGEHGLKGFTATFDLSTNDDK